MKVLVFMSVMILWYFVDVTVGSSTDNHISWEKTQDNSHDIPRRLFKRSHLAGLLLGHQSNTGVGGSLIGNIAGSVHKLLHGAGERLVDRLTNPGGFQFSAELNVNPQQNSQGPTGYEQFYNPSSRPQQNYEGQQNYQGGQPNYQGDQQNYQGYQQTYQGDQQKYQGQPQQNFQPQGEYQPSGPQYQEQVPTGGNSQSYPQQNGGQPSGPPSQYDGQVPSGNGEQFPPSSSGQNRPLELNNNGGGGTYYENGDHNNNGNDQKVDDASHVEYINGVPVVTLSENDIRR